MKNVKMIVLAILGILLLVGCEDRSVDFKEVYTDDETLNRTTVNLEEELRPVVLGKRLENPFSVRNMQIALDSLLNTSSDANLNRRNAEVINISATDWYICFKVDSSQFCKLISDTTLILSQVPLDYEIQQTGDYLEEFQNSEIKTLYTVVKPGYKNDNGIDFELIEELFIPENSEYYLDDEDYSIENNHLELRSLSSKKTNNDFLNALLLKSFTLTGNEQYLSDKQLVERSLKIQNGKTYYQPDGYIRYKTLKGEEPVKGVTIIMRRWFTCIKASTDEYGYYKSDTKLSKLLIGNNVQYYLNMNGCNGSFTWHLDTNIFGAACLWVNEYSLGSHSPDHNIFYITSKDKAWRQCLVNNAVYDYITYVRKEGLTTPPNNLRFAVGNNGIASSAPLFKQYYNEDVALLLSLSAVFVEPLVAFVPALLPDIIINCANTDSLYYSTYATTWHELTHGAHLQAMLNHKGKEYATTYWTTIVKQEFKNSISGDKKTYGKKGDKNWEYIALAEGWANYREWKMCMKYLEYNPISEVIGPTLDPFYDRDPADETKLIYYRYGGLLKDLNKIISDKVFEETISSTSSISGLRQQLLQLNPRYINKINDKFDYYETLQ